VQTAYEIETTKFVKSLRYSPLNLMASGNVPNYWFTNRPTYLDYF